MTKDELKKRKSCPMCNYRNYELLKLNWWRDDGHGSFECKDCEVNFRGLTTEQPLNIRVWRKEFIKMAKEEIHCQQKLLARLEKLNGSRN